MNQSLLERSLENRYTPESVKRKTKKQMYGKPDILGNKLSEDAIKRITIRPEN